MEPKFKAREIVRYSGGPTALMRISSISQNHGGKGQHRYYGTQFYGDSQGAYESDLQPATPEEILRFETDDHIGRLRDYGSRLNPPTDVKACFEEIQKILDRHNCTLNQETPGTLVLIDSLCGRMEFNVPALRDKDAKQG